MGDKHDESRAEQRERERGRMGAAGVRKGCFRRRGRQKEDGVGDCGT